MKVKKIKVLLLVLVCVFISHSSIKNTSSVKADTVVETGYTNFAQSYFDNLTTYFGRNYYGSCGFIAMAMLLSYYDTFHSDSIIPENYDAPSINGDFESTNMYNMVNRNNFPGVLDDIVYNPTGYDSGSSNDPEKWVKNLKANEYYALLQSQENSSLHAKLILLGVSMGYINLSSVTEKAHCGITNNEAQYVLHTYLQNVANLTTEDYTLYVQFNDIGTAFSNWHRQKAIEYVQQGIPVMISIEKEELVDGKMETSRHMVVAYDYNEELDELYCHFGYHNNNMLHITPESQNYTAYCSIFALTFNTPHSCSNNYVVQDYDANGNIVENTYCYEHKDIITYDHVCEYTDIEELPDDNESHLTFHKKNCHCQKYIYEEHNLACSCEGHRYIYTFYNNNKHKITCSHCSSVDYANHVFTTQDRQFCIVCKSSVKPGTIGEIIMPLQYLLVSANGSYVMPNGCIVLVPEDIESYFNGTLIFYNPSQENEVV